MNPQESVKAKLARMAELRSAYEEYLALESEVAEQVVEFELTIMTDNFYVYPAKVHKTDHEAAARDAKVPFDLVREYTTWKESIAWAKITKAAGIPKQVLDAYTKVDRVKASIEWVPETNK